MVICLEQDADLHMAQQMPLPLTSVKSRLVLPLWYWLTQVVPDRAVKRVCVCVCVCNQLKQKAINRWFSRYTHVTAEWWHMVK